MALGSEGFWMAMAIAICLLKLHTTQEIPAFNVEIPPLSVTGATFRIPLSDERFLHTGNHRD